MNRIPCPLCASEGFDLVYDDNPSRIVRCQSCHLVFFNPQPSEAFLDQYYSSASGYIPSIEETLRNFERDPSSAKQEAYSILDQILRHFPGQSPGRILDVGAAYGFFLLSAKERGFEPFGLEVSSVTSRYAVEHGIDVQHSSLLKANFQNEFFDAITMNNVLEHTLSPVSQLVRARELLKPGGVIYISVPNFDSLVSQVDNFYWKWKAWPNHLFYFTPNTLRKILNKTGLEICELVTQKGQSDYGDDVRIVRDRLKLRDQAQIDDVIRLLWKFEKGQQLVAIARKT